MSKKHIAVKAAEMIAPPKGYYDAEQSTRFMDDLLVPYFESLGYEEEDNGYAYADADNAGVEGGMNVWWAFRNPRTGRTLVVNIRYDERAEWGLPSARESTGEPSSQPVYLYHVTTPENAALILRDGFKDHATELSHGVFDPGPHVFPPGVWFADVPSIGAISVDGRDFMRHADEAWIRITLTEDEFWSSFARREIEDFTWPTRQWLVPARTVNEFPRDEMSLQDVLAHRLASEHRHHRANHLLSAHFISDMIEQEISDPGVKARWRDALDQVVS